jgi:hypothetical protein
MLFLKHWLSEICSKAGNHFGQANFPYKRHQWTDPVWIVRQSSLTAARYATTPIDVNGKVA